MGGSEEGAKKAVTTQKNIYGEDHFAVIGAIGGKKGKGWKHTEETKRKISETKKRKAEEVKQDD